MPGKSLPASFTAAAFGASTRKVTCRSAATSGETTGGGMFGRWATAVATKVSAANSATVEDLGMFLIGAEVRDTVRELRMLK